MQGCVRGGGKKVGSGGCCALEWPAILLTFAHAVPAPEGIVTIKKRGTVSGALRAVAPRSRVFVLLAAGLHHPTGTVNAGGDDVSRRRRCTRASLPATCLSTTV